MTFFLVLGSVDAVKIYSGYSILMVAAGAAATLSLGERSGFAQAKIVPEEEVAEPADTDWSGWNPSLKVNATFNVVSNSNLAGQVEGTSMVVGGGAVAGADYVQGPHVWRNQFSIAENFSRTPSLNRFVKSRDAVTLSSLYSHFLSKSLGFFGRVGAQTTLFDSIRPTEDQVAYSIAIADPNSAALVVSTDSLKVASALKPASLSEAIGIFAEPLDVSAAQLSVRAGLGGRHTFASDVLVENDDASTSDVVEMQELSDVQQIGVEFFAGLDGELDEGRVTYSVGGSALFPFYNNDAYNRSALDLMRLGVEAEATVEIFNWMNLVYQATYLVDPQLFTPSDELAQFQTSLLASFNLTLIAKRAVEKK